MLLQWGSTTQEKISYSNQIVMRHTTNRLIHQTECREPLVTRVNSVHWLDDQILANRGDGTRRCILRRFRREQEPRQNGSAARLSSLR